MAEEIEKTVIGKIKSKSVSKCEQEWSIEVDQEAVRIEREAFFSSVTPKVTLPGFRKGKAPRHLVEQHLKKEADSEVLNRLLSRSVREAIKDQQEDLIHYPTVQHVQFEKDLLNFTLRVELRPKIKLGKYKGLKVKKDDAQVSAEDVQKVVDRIRERNATFKSVEGRAVAVGDFVVADTVLSVDGKEVERRAEDMFEVAKEGLLPGFVEQITGVQVGEVREVKTAFPKNFPRKEWSEKPAVFQLSIKEIKIKELPQVTDEWIAGISQLKTVSELETYIRKDLEETRAKDVEKAFEEALLEALLKHNKFDVPAGSIERRTKHLVERSVHGLIDQGVAEQKARDIAREREKEIAKEAERQVRIAFLLDAIAEEEGVEISDELFRARLSMLAEQTNQPLEKIEAVYREQEERREALKDQMRYELVIQRIKDATNITR